VDYLASINQYLVEEGSKDRLKEAERLLGMPIGFVNENFASNSG